MLIKLNPEHYIILDSVGCALDIHTGNIYPLSANDSPFAGSIFTEECMGYILDKGETDKDKFLIKDWWDKITDIEMQKIKQHFTID